MTSTEGTDGKECHECPLYERRKSKNTDNLYQASDFNSEACKTQASIRPLASELQPCLMGELISGGMQLTQLDFY